MSGTHSTAQSPVRSLRSLSLGSTARSCSALLALALPQITRSLSRMLRIKRLGLQTDRYSRAERLDTDTDTPNQGAPPMTTHSNPGTPLSLSPPSRSRSPPSRSPPSRVQRTPLSRSRQRAHRPKALPPGLPLPRGGEGRAGDLPPAHFLGFQGPGCFARYAWITRFACSRVSGAHRRSPSGLRTTFSLFPSARTCSRSALRNRATSSSR